LCYESFILPNAQKKIRKIKSGRLQKEILDLCLHVLPQNPFMDRSCKVKGHKDLRRVYSADGSHRIIYSVHDDLREVFIVTVRRRNEGTYKKIPFRSLSAKIKELEHKIDGKEQDSS